ncbi:Protein CBG26605 [Caenorhabditis briggsae]|uniref:Uncharacterized protein n=2 Tax=Caenorhabditis briggsae TaxID=6238 RepID=A0AAE9DYW0_CAEBR|nr:Protein CBG26605 [Caenorhabditis briggsae]ULU13788.1 hypothetical protein L3Y34_016348 [Caenorhabditis briggsae]CAS00585.1 Protein CBG26605 [Caenorhabditis briggsae]
MSHILITAVLVLITIQPLIDKEWPIDQDFFIRHIGQNEHYMMLDCKCPSIDQRKILKGFVEDRIAENREEVPNFTDDELRMLLCTCPVRLNGTMELEIFNPNISYSEI